MEAAAAQGLDRDPAAAVGAVFSPGALKRVGLLHPETSSHLLELLMQASLHSPPPRLLVLDGLSALLGSSSSLSDTRFLQQATRVLSHLLDLVAHLRTSSSTSVTAAGESLSPHTRCCCPVRVIVTEDRLGEREGDGNRAYFSLLTRFCGRVVQLRHSLSPPPIPTPLPSPAPSSARVLIFASAPATVTGRGEREGGRCDGVQEQWHTTFVLQGSVELVAPDALSASCPCPGDAISACFLRVTLQSKSKAA
jgi:hypothetical protein